MRVKVIGLCGILLLCISLVSQADMYKYVDEQGRVSYSNVPIKGAKKIEMQPLTVIPAIKPKAQPAEETERAANAANSKATESKHKELQDAIIKEEALLAESKQALKDGEENPEVFKTTIVGKDGKPQVVTRRAMGRYEEKVKALREAVAQHEQILEALKKELAALP